MVAMSHTCGDLGVGSPLLVCTNLTVYTPDRSRTLIGNNYSDSPHHVMISHKNVVFITRRTIPHCILVLFLNFYSQVGISINQEPKGTMKVYLVEVLI